MLHFFTFAFAYAGMNACRNLRGRAVPRITIPRVKRYPMNLAKNNLYISSHNRSLVDERAKISLVLSVKRMMLERLSKF